MRKLLLIMALLGLLAAAGCMQWFGDTLDQWFPQRGHTDTTGDEQ
jgi:hypothetical protein